MEIVVKKFYELTLDELHDLLELRSEVFVVEQDCVYQDVDGKDKEALHVLGKNGKQLVAYTRCFAPGYYFEEAAIGRVVVDPSERTHGYGHEIIKASILAVEDKYKSPPIKLSAQTYLQSFYEGHGFSRVGDEYLEDGIPHIAMIRS